LQKKYYTVLTNNFFGEKMSKFKLTKQHQKFVGLLSIIVFLVFMSLVCYFIGKPMIKLASSPDIFRDWIDSKGFSGKLIFIGMVALQVVFAIIPGEPLEIGAGYAFGAIEGTILCIVGALAGSVIVFAFVRTFGVRLVEIFYPIDKINNLKLMSNQKRFYTVIFLIYLIPGTPKDMIVYFLGLTKINPAFFLFTVSIARLPSIVTSTIGGNALGLKNYITAIIVFAITLAVSIVGYLIYNRISTKK